MLKKGGLKIATIYFSADLKFQVLDMAKSCYDLADVAKDLSHIDNVLEHGNDANAKLLDIEMTEKYGEAIKALLTAANAFPVTNSANIVQYSAESQAMANLKQDYWAIICHTAIKCGLKQNFKECISRVYSQS